MWSVNHESKIHIGHYSTNINCTRNTKFTWITNKRRTCRVILGHGFTSVFFWPRFKQLLNSGFLTLHGRFRAFSLERPLNFTSIFVVFSLGVFAQSRWTPLPHPQWLFLAQEDNAICISTLIPTTLKWSSSSSVYLQMCSKVLRLSFVPIS